MLFNCHNIIDQKERQTALDTRRSFIVQAPAGSGKTELLAQRFLGLLAGVKQVPEEIIAITFTRKAATEMRARIFEALTLASTQEAPEKPHELQTWQLAKDALERDQFAKWNLLHNPNRLRILTIDALCARIAKAAPLISHFGTVPKVVEDARAYYSEAAHLLLASLEETTPFGESLKKLLLHLDNNYFLAENLFVSMLSRRDQWLANVVNHRNANDSREVLEAGLKNIISDTLINTENLISKEDKEELLSLARYAGNNVKIYNLPSRLSQCQHLKQFPSSNVSQYDNWIGLAELLLTKSFEWRKTVNKNCGFPPATEGQNHDEKLLFKTMKERMVRLLNKLSKNNHLLLQLKNILLLPPPAYSENQWQVIRALTELLPVLVAYLHITFREHNITDFIAIAQGAIQALGEEDNPSDIALNLDYQIQHLLVDEFQDTSVTQYRLLKLLTAGWQENDGRTLFFVGDPMQSIYRFREADVGIFLKVKKYGLGDVKLIPLTLRVNFRSQANIVNWFNETFNTIFPSQENSELGAIAFSPSTALLDEAAEIPAVFIHSLSDESERGTEHYIISLIKKEMARAPEKSIALLVRSRSHLQEIIPELKKHNIAFQAVEIEKLIYSAAVQDLLALTKALSHPGDRIAWLGILRAPWCGLHLADLYLIANHDPHATIWQTLNSFTKIEKLSTDAIERLDRIVPILARSLHERSRAPFRTWVAYTWYALGGPACLDEEYELQNTDAYLALLEHFSSHAVVDFKLLEQKLANAYCHSATSQPKLHLMTIHKAKGLEFDIVILPALEKKPATDESQLLLWLERQNSKGDIDLILAPIKSLEEEYDAIYRYVRLQHTLKSQLEVARLLYVAVTRTKETLHLLGKTIESDDANEVHRDPPAGSFLALLWPTLQPHFKNKELTTATTRPEAYNEVIKPLKRLNKNWSPPSLLAVREDTSPTFANHPIIWAQQYLHHVGTVVHQCIAQRCDRSFCDVEGIFADHEQQIWKKKLCQLGVSHQHLDHCLLLIAKALSNMLQDGRGRWIISNEHREAKCEYPISLYHNQAVQHYIIDRTFIDEKGTRWIIDYKTSDLDGEETLFLANAKLCYADQLEKYAKAVQLIEKRQIKLGLYFPLFSGWCEWDYEP